MKKIFTVLWITIFTSSLLCAIDYQYNARNELSQVMFANGYSISYSYDSNGNLTSQLVTQPNVKPLSPTQFNIYSSDGQMIISWEPVNNNIDGTPIIVPVYVIESSSNPFDSFSQIGTTSQTQFTVPLSDRHGFFRVRATVNYQREDVEPDDQIGTEDPENRSSK